MVLSAAGMRDHNPGFPLLHRLVDALTILLSLHFALQWTDGVIWEGRQMQADVWAMLIFLVLGGTRQLYSSWRMDSLAGVLASTLSVWAWTAAILVLLAFLTHTSSDFSRLTTLVWFGMTPALLVAQRVAYRMFIKRFGVPGQTRRTVAIAGLTRLGGQVENKVKEAHWLGLELIGYYDDRENLREEDGFEGAVGGLGSFEQLISLARAGAVDFVYITLPMRAEKRIVELVNALADTTASVYVVPNFFVFDLLHGKMSSLDGIPVLGLFESPFYGVDGWLKRVEDVVVASLILILIAFPMLIIALGVKITSPGPVIFRQRRYGLNGKVVEVWKFRSMTVCEDGDAVRQASKNDSRVTAFGAFLRRTSLDELPQFFNVLQGTMSVVGPRPHAIAHNEQYRGLIRGYMLRHKVKPGITGWAQINGWRGETQTLEKMSMRVKYDLEYVQSWSLWLDLKIIFLTVFKGFSDKNAY